MTGRVVNRFEAKINRSKDNDCWEWTGALNGSGYGSFCYNGKTTNAHRVSWLIHNGSIPKGEGHHGTCVLHKCDNRKCVNPDHLFLGSNADNIKDRESKGRGVMPEQAGHKNPSYDHTAYTFKHKTKGWKIRCTQFYLRKTFELYNVSDLVLGKRKSVGGWALA